MDRTIIYDFVEAANNQEFTSLTEYIYRGGDVFVVMFSVVSRSSFENVQTQHVPAIRRSNEVAPIVLVGNKYDLVCYPDEYPAYVTFEEASEVARSIGAVAYIECSALTRTNVDETVEEATRAVLTQYTVTTSEQQKKDKCHMM